MPRTTCGGDAWTRREMRRLVVLFFLSVFCSSAFGQDQPIEQRVLWEAVAALKTPYKWGGVDLKNGVDCSGFTQKVFERAGAKIPRTVAGQLSAGRRVKVEDIHIGDLVFFKDKPGGTITHVGIYAGNGRMIHSPRTGMTVRANSIFGKTYGHRLAQVRRVVESKFE